MSLELCLCYCQKLTPEQKLEQKLSEISLDKLVIFVTHQVNIQAITKKNVASGEMVAFNTSTKKSHKINLSVQ